MCVYVSIYLFALIYKTTKRWRRKYKLKKTKVCFAAKVLLRKKGSSNNIEQFYQAFFLKPEVKARTVGAGNACYVYTNFVQKIKKRAPLEPNQ